MKRMFSLLLFASLALSANTVQEKANKEEYEYRQDWLMKGSKAAGAAGGALVGGVAGARGGVDIGGDIGRKIAIKQQPYAEDAGYYGMLGGLAPGATIGAATGATIGGVAGYKLGEKVGFWALQKKYGVPAKVAQVSIVYGLLLSRNKSLLMAAYDQNKEAIRELLSKKMRLIFGRDWKQKIVQFLNEYQTSPLAFEANFKQRVNRKLARALEIFNAVAVLNSGNYSFMPFELEDQMDAMKYVFQTFLQ